MNLNKANGDVHKRLLKLNDIYNIEFEQMKKTITNIQKMQK